MTLSRKTKYCICIAVLLAISIYIYVYYTVIIKMRLFPENGDVSLSGCYVTELYFIGSESPFVEDIYYYPGFVKVFDAKTKKCLYTSDIYDIDYLFPIIKLDNSIRYGFLRINTRCEKKFIPPKEFSPDELN